MKLSEKAIGNLIVAAIVVAIGSIMVLSGWSVLAAEAREAAAMKACVLEGHRAEDCRWLVRK